MNFKIYGFWLKILMLMRPKKYRNDVMNRLSRYDVKLSIELS